MSLTYQQSGVRYDAIDPIKKLAQAAARGTAASLRRTGAREFSASRGESAYVWRQGGKIFASVMEGLGTKNLVADAMYEKTGKSYYDIMAHDTVACIVNDLSSIGATPTVLHAYWATGSSDWFSDKKRALGLIRGWQKACKLAHVSWGGGETPALAGIVASDTIDLGGCATGMIEKSSHLLSDKKLRANDRIILLKSNGVNANGLTLARAVAKKLPKGYFTKLPNDKRYGDALLTRSNIYSPLISHLLSRGVRIHYIANITGHGLRKVMRARPAFTYTIEKIFKPQPIFSFIQHATRLSDYEMYQTFNMGQDYAIFVPKKDVAKTLRIIKTHGFTGLDAGYIQKGKRQVMIEPLNIVYSGDTLDIR